MMSSSSNLRFSLTARERTLLLKHLELQEWERVLDLSQSIVIKKLAPVPPPRKFVEGLWKLYFILSNSFTTWFPEIKASGWKHLILHWDDDGDLYDLVCCEAPRYSMFGHYLTICGSLGRGTHDINFGDMFPINQGTKSFSPDAYFLLNSRIAATLAMSVSEFNLSKFSLRFRYGAGESDEQGTG